MTTELQDCHFGLICLTPDNLIAPWIHFEAGSLSKMIDRSRLVPILFKLEQSDVQGPLAQFQMVNFGQDQIYGVLQSINNAAEELKLDESRLKTAFRVFWPELEKSISEIEFTPDKERHLSPTETKLEEILILTRQQSISSSKPFAYIVKQLEHQLVLLHTIVRANKVGIRTLEEVQLLSEVWPRFSATLGDYMMKLTDLGLTHDDLKPLFEGTAKMYNAVEKLVELSGAEPMERSRVRPQPKS